MFATPYKIVTTRHVKRVTAHISCLLLFLTTTIWIWHTTGIANGLSLSPAVPSSSGLSAASGNDFKPDHNGKYWIYGDGIWAAFIPYGASISDLIIKDRHGVSRDIVVGYDNATAYVNDRSHPHLGGVPGRYANRIRNSTFVMDGQKYNIAPNENPTSDHHEGVDTLHGGPDGWDWRNFTIVSHTNSSITFSLVDPDGKEGFPGEVVSKITYTLDGMDWNIKMVAQPTTHKTPIMLTSHTYWNLDGFANNETHTALNHTLHLPYSDQRIGVDNILIPDGTIVPNSNGSVNDFWSKPKHIGAQLDDPELVNNCGFNCRGYDNCYLVNREHLGPYDWQTEGPVATLSSEWSGIQIDIFTNQDAFQVYSCNGMNGAMPIKRSQGATDLPRTIPKYGCLVMEVQDWIDSINHPEWERDDKHFFEPHGSPYVLEATYSFSVKG